MLFKTYNMCIKYTYSERSFMNLYLDFDGVIADTIVVTYKMIEERGIDINDRPKVCEFYRTLNWFNLLSNIDQINNSIKYIKKLQSSGLYNMAILTTVNSLEEISAKKEYIRKFGLNLPIISVPKGVSKSELVDAKQAILVDDYGGNLYPWEKAGGIGVKFSNKESNEFITISSLSELSNSKFVKKLIKKI